MNVNKNIPIVTLKALKEFEDSVPLQLCHITHSDESLLLISDNDINSGFFFKIKEFDDKAGIYVAYRPQNHNSTAETGFWIKPADVGNYFSVWHKCLVELDEMGDLFSDPYLKNFEKGFFESFNLDDDVKKEPLSLKEIHYLEENLSKIQNEIAIYIPQNREAEMAEIIKDAENLKDNLGRQTKGWIAKRLSTLCAKITKAGPGILRSIFKEVGKQLMTEGIKYLLENGNKLIG